MNLNTIIRTSEFWVGFIGVLAMLGATFGIWSISDFDQYISPALTYIVARVLGKAAKAVVPTTTKEV